MIFRQKPQFAALRRFRRHHGAPGTVGRIVGGPLRWHIYNPERVVVVYGRRKRSS